MVDGDGVIHRLRHEYNNMSRRPGIGGEWFDRFSNDVYRGHDYVVVNGVRCRPPRYFDKLLERIDPDRFAEVKEERVKTAEQFADNNTPERLAVREEVAFAKYGQLSPRNDAL